jgi:hypothetical protein
LLCQTLREERIILVMAEALLELLRFRRSCRRQLCQTGVASGAEQRATCSEVSSGQGQRGHLAEFQALIWCILWPMPLKPEACLTCNWWEDREVEREARFWWCQLIMDASPAPKRCFCCQYARVRGTEVTSIRAEGRDELISAWWSQMHHGSASTSQGC